MGGESVIVAVSGGADSISLLLAMNNLRERAKINNRLVAAHFNHRLRAVESDADEAFVRSLTSQLKLELVIGSSEIRSEGNLEQNARDARYEFLAETAKNLRAFGVLTGHTVNDQAETFLMNLIRGSGQDGLSGMRAIRTLDGGKVRGKESKNEIVEGSVTSHHPTLSVSHPLLIRPFLHWAKRSDTEAFCRDMKVEYRYDTMNEDTAFRRVRIRKILMPLLEDFNPKIVETLANTAMLMQNLPETERAVTAHHEEKLTLNDLARIPKADLYDTIRAWLGLHRGTTRLLTLKHIAAVARLVMSTKSGRTVELPGGRVVKTGGRLVYEDNKVEKKVTDI